MLLSRLKIWRRLLNKEFEPEILSDLLIHVDPKADLASRVRQVELLLRWLKGRSELGADAKVRYLKMQIEKKPPEFQAAFSAMLRSVIRDCSALRVFLLLGTATEHGILTEIVQRILIKILPQVPRHDLLEILLSALGDEEGEIWITSLSAESVQWLRSLIEVGAEENPWIEVESDSRDALIILSSTITYFGLATDVRLRHSIGKIPESPFITLQRLISENATASTNFDQALGLCRQVIQAVYKNMESKGVSVGLVYRLETLNAALNRIEELNALINPAGPASSEINLRVQNLLREVLGILQARSSVRNHLAQHFDLLSRKIVERNGQSGEHYVAHDGQGRRRLFMSSIGGGVIVVGMTALKTLLHHVEPAPLVFATGAWMIYAVGFLTMQFTGATLATKIPSFTASHLAQKLRGLRRREDVGIFSLEMRATVYSQMLALLGNVVGLVPFVYLTVFVLRSLGFSLMGASESRQVLDGIHPFLSPAVLLGALTGLELWLSSMAGGWLENWLVFRGVPDAIAQHPRLHRVIGIENAKVLAGWVSKNASGIATNISLGFLFGFVPLIGNGLGLNLEGKHVTLTTTGALFGYFSLGPNTIPTSVMVMGLIGLFLIGLMNFTVSFAMALNVAARASGIKRPWLGYALAAATGLKRETK